MKSFKELILFFSVVLISSFGLKAQEVISTQGASYFNAYVKWDFTIGEPVIFTGSSANNVVTQGFHQPLLQFYADADGDGYGDVASFVWASIAPVGYISNNTDCNDANAAVNPAALEICNSIDDDCDTQIDEGTGSMYYADADGDGYGAMSGMTTQGNSTVVFTSTGLIINGSNEQMGGMNVQGEAQFVVPADGVYTFDWSYSTNDVDGANMDPAYYINGVPVLLTDDFGADLQSGSVSVNVTAGSTFGFEIIALDNVLGEATLVITNFNGISNFTGVQSCTPIVGYVTVGGDCNDNLSGTNPGASEICNTSDDDCDGSVDDGIILTTYYQDMDMDGYGGTNSVQACTAPNPMYVAQGGDCEDFNPTVNPAATEVCNSIDDDCDTQIDEGTGSMYYADADGDGYGAMSGMTTQGNSTVVFTSTGLIINGSNEQMVGMDVQGEAQFVVPADGVYTFDWSYTTNDVDGADMDPAYYINGVPVLLTDDFGADIQSGTVSVNVTAGSTFGFEIIALDNVLGEATLVITNFNALSNFTGVQSCTPIVGYVTVGGDCNDNLSGTNPGASEICNTSDDDCDGSVDDGIILTTYYQDMDMDGYGGTNSVQACTAPNPMYVAQGGDCEDFNPTVNPAATEVCNSIDDDCDGSVDEGAGSTYYSDADGDGYGAGTATIACTAPVGMVANSTDCNDNSSAVNPGASEICNLIDDDCDGTADDGVPVINYYSDIDGDTFGGTLITSTCASLTGNFVAVGGDCDDSNTAINPSAVEICLNSIDDDCDGVVNDGCLPDQLFGESPATAAYAWTTFYPSCVTSTHTLAGFSPSLSAQTVCLTGEDKWHYFTATSEAVSIQVASSANDILLELQNPSGTLIATENVVAGLGGEILNFSGLVSGQVYKVGVRNYNSALGIGSYTLCVKMLKRGGCDYGPGPYSLCQYFKASYGGTGTTYTFTFTGISGNASGNVYTRTQTSDICVLSNVSPSLPYGSTYNVLITSTYTLLDGAGNSEVIAVPGLSPCTMSTVSQPATSLRTSDQCVNGTRFRGSIVASLPWVCGVNNWRWEFTEVNPLTYATIGLPIAVNRGAASNYINLGTVAALQNGKTYAVRTAPILPGTGSNYQWGSTYYMCIIGSAGMVVENNNAPALDTKSEIASEANMSLYPNPTHGTDVNINLSGIESENVHIRIVDAMGKQVWSNRYAVNGVLNTNITFERPLANGLYFVEAIFNGEVQTQRMMVQK